MFGISILKKVLCIDPEKSVWYPDPEKSVVYPDPEKSVVYPDPEKKCCVSGSGKWLGGSGS